MEIPRRRIVEWGILFLSSGFASAGWVSVAMISPGSGRWVVSTVFFSLFAVGFLSAAALYRERGLRIAFVACSLLPSLPFSPNVAHLLFLAVSAASLLRGFESIGRDLSSRLRLSLRKSMAAGAFSFAVAVSLLVASQYHAEIRNASWQDLVPRFSLAEGSGDFVLHAAGSFSPEIRKIGDERMTVDSFLATVRSPEGYVGSGETGITDEVVSALSLEAGREELGRLVGRNLSGTERMRDVLAEALRNKTIAFLSGAKAERNLSDGTLPLFLSFLLFITVLSIASFLQGVWTMVSTGVIRLLIRLGALSVERVPTEQEMLR